MLTRISKYVIITVFSLLTIAGCTDSSDTAKDVKAKTAWQRYSEVRKSKDLKRTLAVIDSMEHAKIISTAKADYLRGIAYDQGWQMRIAEHFYKKSFEGYAPKPAQDWQSYTDAGFRWAYLRYSRGDTEGALSVVSGLLSQAKGNDSFPRSTEAALLMLMADSQKQLHQYDEARLNWEKAYEIQQQDIQANQSAELPWLSMSISSSLFTMDDVAGALKWLERVEQEFANYEQQGDSLIIEEWKGHIALKRALYLQKSGHAAEAASTFASVPRSRLFEPRAYSEAAEYLTAAGRYAEAIYWYEQIDSTYVATDGAQMTFDVIINRLAPRYSAYRTIGRNADALIIADSICTAIDSALVWQKKNDAAELAVIYHTHEKELALDESEFQATVYRILALSLVVILLIIIIALWRLAIAHRRVLAKNRELYEVVRHEQALEVSDIERIALQPEQERTPNEQLFLRLVELMNSQRPYTDTNLNRDTLAQMLGTNHRYVDDAIRECSDSQSTNAFINSYRVDYAARLLIETSNTIALIAEMSGFANRTTFNEQFRSRYKMTPSEYRQAAKA